MYFLNIKQNNIKMKDVIEKQAKHYKKIKEHNPRNLIIKILLLIIFLSISKLSFNSLKFDLSLTKKIIKDKKILSVKTKKRIITIGFYDVIHCNRRWRRVKKGYFYDLPKYTNKFRWVFLAKNGVESDCNKYTHITFRKANNFENLEKAVVENKIDIIIQNDDENLKEHKYLLELKVKYGTKLVQIMHEYYCKH